MENNENDKKLDEMIVGAIGEGKVKFDAESWKQKYSKEYSILTDRSHQVKKKQSWLNFVESRVVKFAAAAVIIVAVMIAINHMGGSIDGSSSCWASLAERVMKIDSFTYRIKVNMSNIVDPVTNIALSDGMEMLAYNSREHGLRVDNYNNGNLLSSVFVDPETKMMLSVMHDQKKYIKMQMNDEQFREYQMKNDPREMIRTFLMYGFDEIGRAQVDGVECEGVMVTDPNVFAGVFSNVRAELWVDVESDLPVMMKFDVNGTDVMNMSMVMDEFDWNADVDVELFAPALGDDYEAMVDIDMPSDDGKAAVEGLGICVDILGKYPRQMSVITTMTELMKDMMKKLDPNDPYPSKEDMQRVTKIQMVCLFYSDLIKNGKEPAYYGSSVKPGDGDSVLMRWKLPDGKYRVIFGDLASEKVSFDELQELEADLK